MDGEQTVDVQPDVSEIAPVLPPEVHVESPNDAMDVSTTPVALDPSAEIQTDVSRNKGDTTEVDEFSQNISSEVIVDVASELPEPSLPSWIAEEVSDELTEIFPIAMRYVKAKRGGDMLGIILPTLDPDTRSRRKGKLSLLVIIKGEERNAQWIRVKRHMIQIFYRGQKGFEEEVQTSLSLPPLLRKARVLFERDGVASKICDMTAKRFRQGPPSPSINEKIHLKAECYHWLGKIQEATDHPDRARYILPAFIDQIVVSWFCLRGLWHVSASSELQFILSRDKATGEGLGDIWKENDIRKQIELAQQIAAHVLKDVPWPARID